MKKIFMSLLILIILLGSASVWANELNETIMDMDNPNDELIEVDNNNDSLEITNCDNEVGAINENSLSASVGTFDELSNLISQSSTVLDLQKDYKYFSGSTEGITISKSITINGNGHYINGGNVSRAFKITASNVVLKNIIFKDCEYQVGSLVEGGAIYWSGSYGTITNCSFTHCVAGKSDSSITHYGGAVYWKGSNGKISNCIFTNCKAYSSFYIGEYSTYAPSSPITSYGGAVYWMGSGGSIDNCQFKDCIAQSYYNVYAGAISPKTYAYGGAVYWNGVDGDLCSSKFSGCQAYSYAITRSGSFSESESYGGAVYWKTNAGEVSNCEFIKCLAKAHSMAENSYQPHTITCGNDIFAEGAGLTISSSIFLENYGDCIYWEGSNGKISNSLLYSTEQLMRASTSVNANYNWWGNTVDDITSKPRLSSGITANKLLCLDLSASTNSLNLNENAIIQFNFNKLISGYSILDYSDSMLPNLNFPLKDEKGISYYAQIQNGFGEYIYTLKSSSGGSITINYAGIKKTFNFNYVESRQDIASQVTIPSLDEPSTYGFVKINLPVDATGSVTLVIDNNDYKFPIQNGVANVKVPDLTNGDYYYTISYSGDNKYLPFSKTNTLSIKNMGSPNSTEVPTSYTINTQKISISTKITKNVVKITAKKKTFKIKNKIKKYSIILKANGKAVKNVKVTLKVKGKTYTAKTNSKGKATFKITKLTKKGTFKSVITYKGNNFYTKATKTIKIKIK